jgi:predicted amidohydrolase YtcJ
MPDLILFNANAITMNPAQPFAQLIAIEGGKISLVSGNETLGSLKSKKTQIIDCKGKTLLPGFIDAHCHIHAYAEKLVSLDLSPGAAVNSIPDLQGKIREAANSFPPGAWIRGKSYNEFYLSEKRHPNRRDLDAAALLHPIKLTHRSGHAHVLNSLALQIAGIDETTGDPPGGVIDRDVAGIPTGILYGLGGYLAEKIPPLEDAEMERGISLVDQKLISCGITSVQDASVSNGPDTWRRFEIWKGRSIFRPRVTMMIGLNAFMEQDQKSYPTAIHNDELRLGGVKIIVDEVTGSLNPSQEELDKVVFNIHTADRQAVIHAIEEPAIGAAADAIESALKRHPRKDHRHRIEHCSVCRPALLQRLARLGITVVTQPCFIYASGDRYLQTMPAGELEHLYPVRSMLEAGMAVGAGSDFPIADPNPLIGIYAAVTRLTEGIAALPQQRIGVMDALRIHTIDAAAAAFQEGEKGSLTPGKLADIVMPSENPLEAAPEQIKDIQILMTVLGGKVIWD